MCRSTSETANIPMSAGMKWIPPSSSIDPKVKRGWPETTSKPTVDTVRPTSNDATDFTRDRADMKTAHVRPSVASQKYSYELNCSANSASTGAAIDKTTAPTRPPSAE